MVGEETGGIFATGLEDEVDTYDVDFDSKAEAGSNALTVTSAAGEFNNGAKGGKIAYAGSSPTGYCQKDIGAQTDIWIRFFFKWATGSQMGADFNSVALLTVLHSDGFTKCCSVIARRESGTFNKILMYIYYNGDASNVEIGGITFSLNTWHRAEVHYKIDGSVGGAELWIDGSSEGSDFTLDTSGKMAELARIGGGGASWPANSPDAGSEMYFDDVKADTSYIGEFSVDVVLSAALASFAAPATSTQPGAVTKALQPTVGSFSAPATSTQPGAITIVLSPAVATFAAPAVTVTNVICELAVFSNFSLSFPTFSNVSLSFPEFTDVTVEF